MNWLKELFRSRADRMTEQARALDMSYYPTADRKTLEHIRQFELMRIGRRQKVKNLLHQRREEMDIHIFDYQYYVGKNSRKKPTVFWIESNVLDLPTMLMRPEHFGHSFLRIFGQKDINFENYPAFSSKYWLRGTPESDVRYLMTHDMLNYFSLHDGWYMECAAQNFILYRYKKRYPAENLRQLMDSGLKVFDMLSNRGTGRLV